MRILFDATNIIDKPTGAGLYAYHLLRASLPHYATDRITVLVQARLSHTHPLFQLQNVCIVPIAVPTIGLKRDIYLSYWLWRHRFSFDLYCSFMPYLPLLFSLPRSCITIHDLGYLHFPQFFHRPWHRWYFNLLLTKSLARAVQVFTVSESTKKDILHFFPKVSTSQIVVVSEASGFVDSRDGEGKKDKQTPYFLYVGERRPHKNLLNLISAFAQVLIIHPEFQLVLVGKDYQNYTGKLSYLIDSLHLTARIKILNSATEEELKSLYKNATALTLVSYYEGFGLPLVEAMQFGVPIIASNVYSLPEVAGDAAVYVDPNNVRDIAQKMVCLVDDENLRNKLIAAGAIRYTQFSWDTSAQIFSHSLRSLISNKNNIVIFDKFLGYNVGGAQRSLHYLLRHTPLLQPVVLIGCKLKNSFAAARNIVDGLSVQRFSITEWPRFPYLEYLFNRSRVRRTIVDKSPALLITQGLWGVAAISASKGKNIYFVRDEYQLNRIPLYQRGFKKIMKLCYLVLQFPGILLLFRDNQRAIKRADIVIANSHYIAREIKRCFNRDAVVVYPPLESDFLKRARLFLPASEGYITCIGSEYMKGRTVVEQIAKAMPESKFMIVGREFAVPEQRGNILFQPWTHDPFEIYKQTKVLLVPSICQEAFGRTALEAEALGIPVVATARGGLPEVVPTEFLVVNPWDIIAWKKGIQQTVDHYDERSSQARQAAEPYTTNASIVLWNHTLLALMS